MSEMWIGVSGRDRRFLSCSPGTEHRLQGTITPKGKLESGAVEPWTLDLPTAGVLLYRPRLRKGRGLFQRNTKMMQTEELAKQLPSYGRRIKFTPEIIQQIRNLVEQGKSREEIAELIGVTLRSLQVTCSRLGISVLIGPR
jgi:hypothetical protein